MAEQLALFAPQPAVIRGPDLRASIPQKPDAEWPHRTWRWTRGVGGGIEYRYPDPPFLLASETPR